MRYTVTMTSEVLLFRSQVVLGHHRVLFRLPENASDRHEGSFFLCHSYNVISYDTGKKVFDVIISPEMAGLCELIDLLNMVSLKAICDCQGHPNSSKCVASQTTGECTDTLQYGKVIKNKWEWKSRLLCNLKSTSFRTAS